MVATIRQYKAACVQSEPGWFDLEKSVRKTVDLIKEAGEKDCKLIAFPETCKSPKHFFPLPPSPFLLMFTFADMLSKGIPGYDPSSSPYCCCCCYIT